MDVFKESLTHPAGALVKLDRKLSKALSDGRGVGLTAKDLEVFAVVGVIELLATAKAEALKAQAMERQKRHTQSA